MLTSRTVAAEELLQIGLINRIAAGDLLTEAESLAHEITKLAPLAIRACLEALRLGAELPLLEGLAFEDKAFCSFV